MYDKSTFHFINGQVLHTSKNTEQFFQNLFCHLWLLLCGYAVIFAFIYYSICPHLAVFGEFYIKHLFHMISFHRGSLTSKLTHVHNFLYIFHYSLFDFGKFYISLFLVNLLSHICIVVWPAAFARKVVSYGRQQTKTTLSENSEIFISATKKAIMEKITYCFPSRNILSCPVRYEFNSKCTIDSIMLKSPVIRGRLTSARLGTKGLVVLLYQG